VRTTKLPWKQRQSVVATILLVAIAIGLLCDPPAYAKQKPPRKYVPSVALQDVITVTSAIPSAAIRSYRGGFQPDRWCNKTLPQKDEGQVQVEEGFKWQTSPQGLITDISARMAGLGWSRIQSKRQGQFAWHGMLSNRSKSSATLLSMGSQSWKLTVTGQTAICGA
jgi:hypothetical protein